MAGLIIGTCSLYSNLRLVKVMAFELITAMTVGICVSSESGGNLTAM